MRAALCVALLIAPGVLPLAPARAQEPASRDVVLDFGEAELATVVEALARATGQRVLFDESLRGRVTITAEDRVSVAEAREVLRAALLLSGFALTPAPGGAQKILSLEGAVSSAPWLRRLERDSDRLITTLVRLDSADAAELAQKLKPGLVEAGLLVAYPATNSLIIATSEARLRRLLEIIRALDQASFVDLRVIPLRYADAETLVQQVQGTFPNGDGEAFYQILADERTNSLIIEALPARLDEIADLLRVLDVPVRHRGALQVVRVLNADAEVLAEELGELRGAGGDAALAELDFDVVADAPTNSLVIRAAPSAFVQLADLIAELDRLPPRVSLDVTLLEVDTTTTLALAFDAIAPLLLPDNVDDAVAIATTGSIAGLLAPAFPGNPFVARIAREPILIPVVLPDGTPDTILVPEGGAQVIAADADLKVRTLLSPHLLAVSGEEQRIFSGQRVPVPTTGDQTAGSSSPLAPAGAELFTTRVDIERQEVGVDLRVKPSARSENSVELELDLTFSSVADASALPFTVPEAALEEFDAFTSLVGPVLRQLDLTAQIRLVDGAVALVGSTPRSRVERAEVGTPFLSSIPLLGFMFRSTSDIERHSQIVVIVSATVIDSPAEQLAESIQRRVAVERQIARTEPLSSRTGAPWALLVTTRASRAGAEEVAGTLADLGRPVEIVAWSLRERRRFDVYVTGFRDITELGPVSILLRERGFQPKTSVVGGFER